MARRAQKTPRTAFEKDGEFEKLLRRAFQTQKAEKRRVRLQSAMSRPNRKGQQ